MGVFAGATGLAGAIIGHPVLNNFSRLSPHLVTGTLCLATSCCAASGAGTFLYLGVVDTEVALVTGLSGVVTAGLGAAAGKRIDPRSLKRLIGIALLVMAPIQAFNLREYLRPPNTTAATSASSEIPRSLFDYTPYIAAGALGGLVQGMLGLGGGLVQLTALSLTGMPQHAALATTLAGTFVLNSSAAAFHYRLGNVHVKAAVMIAGAGMLTASAWASLVTIKMSEPNLRKIVGGALVISAAGMLR